MISYQRVYTRRPKLPYSYICKTTVLYIFQQIEQQCAAIQSTSFLSIIRKPQLLLIPKQVNTQVLRLAAGATGNTIHGGTHVVDHNSSTWSTSALHGRTAVTLDSRKVLTTIHPHDLEANSGFLLNGVGNSARKY